MPDPRSTWPPCPSCGVSNGAHTFACRNIGPAKNPPPYRPKRKTKAEKAAEPRAKVKIPPLVPRVVNRNHYKGRKFTAPWMYIGRNAKDPSRQSPLANTVSTRGDPDALEVYAAWLRERVDAGDPDVLAALRSITQEHSLVCSCAPAPCHGDVVVEVWCELAGIDRGR